MPERTAILASILFLLMPAAASAIRLIERNGPNVTERVVASVVIPSDGVIVIVPDGIFSNGFGGS